VAPGRVVGPRPFAHDRRTRGRPRKRLGREWPRSVGRIAGNSWPPNDTPFRQSWVWCRVKRISFRPRQTRDLSAGHGGRFTKPPRVPVDSARWFTPDDSYRDDGHYGTLALGLRASSASQAFASNSRSVGKPNHGPRQLTRRTSELRKPGQTRRPRPSGIYRPQIRW
jgi:hypothetical protein